MIFAFIFLVVLSSVKTNEMLNRNSLGKAYERINSAENKIKKVHALDQDSFSNEDIRDNFRNDRDGVRYFNLPINSVNGVYGGYRNNIPQALYSDGGFVSEGSDLKNYRPNSNSIFRERYSDYDGETVPEEPQKSNEDNDEELNNEIFKILKPNYFMPVVQEKLASLYNDPQDSYYKDRDVYQRSNLNSNKMFSSKKSYPAIMKRSNNLISYNLPAQVDISHDKLKKLTSGTKDEVKRDLSKLFGKEQPISIEKKSINWSKYFGLDKRVSEGKKGQTNNYFGMEKRQIQDEKINDNYLKKLNYKLVVKRLVDDDAEKKGEKVSSKIKSELPGIPEKSDDEKLEEIFSKLDKNGYKIKLNNQEVKDLKSLLSKEIKADEDKLIESTIKYIGSRIDVDDDNRDKYVEMKNQIIDNLDKAYNLEVVRCSMLNPEEDDKFRENLNKYHSYKLGEDK